MHGFSRAKYLYLHLVGGRNKLWKTNNDIWRVLIPCQPNPGLSLGNPIIPLEWSKAYVSVVNLNTTDRIWQVALAWSQVLAPWGNLAGDQNINCHIQTRHGRYSLCITIVYIYIYTYYGLQSIFDGDIPYTYIHTYVRTYVHTYIHTNIHTYIRTYVSTYVCTYVHTYIHTYIQTDRQTYIPTYLHTYIHTNIHTKIHTYIHTDRQTYLHTYIT